MKVKAKRIRAIRLKKRYDIKYVKYINTARTLYILHVHIELQVEKIAWDFNRSSHAYLFILKPQ